MKYHNIKEIENFIPEFLFFIMMDTIHEERKPTFVIEDTDFFYFVAVTGNDVKINKFNRNDALIDTKTFSFSDMTVLYNEVIVLKTEELEESHSEQY